MGLNNKDYLKEQAYIIRFEKNEGKNTAERIGKAIADVIENTDDTFSSLQSNLVEVNNIIKIVSDSKGQPSGFATLGSDGKLTPAQMPVITSAMLPPEMRVHVGAFDGFEDLVPEQEFEQMGLSPMGAAKVHFSRSKGAFYCVKNAGSLTDRKVYCTWAGNSLMDASLAMGTEDSTRGVVPVTGKLYFCRADGALYLWDGNEMVACGGKTSTSGSEPEAITNEELDAIIDGAG